MKVKSQFQFAHINQTTVKHINGERSFVRSYGADLINCQTFHECEGEVFCGFLIQIVKACLIKVENIPYTVCVTFIIAYIHIKINS